ncbi:MAG: CinA family protein [Candidatus Berkiellales bacterium]
MSGSLLTLAENVGSTLKKRDWKLATAESCTGGGLAYWITAIPGSSDWFDRGYVTYNDKAKQEMLGIKLSTLDQFSAVSQETALEMAIHALSQSKAQVSISITGVAGPTGGTPQSPVGTVWIGIASAGVSAGAGGPGGPGASHAKTEVKHYLFQGTRAEIREQAIMVALGNLLDFIQ